MTLEQHKALARHAIEVWSSGDVATVDEIYAPSYVNYQHHHPDSPHVIRGTEAWKNFVCEFRKAFPDFHDTIEEQVAEGDKVVTRFTSQGTQAGEFMGLPPTGKYVRWTGIVVDRIADDKIVESWGSWDMLGMLQQLGGIALPV
jgi:steroid delta-isomerase-like uncharacterized protein